MEKHIVKNFEQSPLTQEYIAQLVKTTFQSIFKKEKVQQKQAFYPSLDTALLYRTIRVEEARI